MYNTATGALMRLLKGHTDKVTSVIVNPNNHFQVFLVIFVDFSCFLFLVIRRLSFGIIVMLLCLRYFVFLC